jgi:hypothetical protein
VEYKLWKKFGVKNYFKIIQIGGNCGKLDKCGKNFKQKPSICVICDD